MKKLVKEVVEKTGIPEVQAEAAVKAVLTQLKKRLPDDLANQIECIIQTGDSIRTEDIPTLVADKVGGTW